MLIPESFSCLVLEMWVSESRRTIRRYALRNRSTVIHKKLKLLERVSRRRWSSTMESQVTLLAGLVKEKGRDLTEIIDVRTKPTRRLFDDSLTESHLRIRLISAEQGDVLKNIEYDDLRRIGAQTDEPDFMWLWRSGIGAYNRHSRIWHKWLNRALIWWHSWHKLHNSIGDLTLMTCWKRLKQARMALLGKRVWTH